ncbi:MAG TPA: hypothetical protein VGM39_10045 [Kofleriaceae bacterium]|jgi:transposase
MRNRIIFVVLVAVLSGAFILWRRERAVDAERAEIQRRAEIASTARTPESVPVPTPPSHVRKMSKEDRARLAEQIQSSIARRAASAERTDSAGSAAVPTLDVPLLSLEDVGPELKSALDEAVPIIGECYEKYPDRTHSGSDKARVAVALMVMTSDPDVGTIVDADKLTDEDGTPLDAALETCLRDTIQSLALPPIGKPGKLPLQYSFSSRDDDAK